jgi:hypothetical protein
MALLRNHIIATHKISASPFVMPKTGPKWLKNGASTRFVGFQGD